MKLAQATGEAGSNGIRSILEFAAARVGCAFVSTTSRLDDRITPKLRWWKGLAYEELHAYENNGHVRQ
jgi:hypothetical protein